MYTNLRMCINLCGLFKIKGNFVEEQYWNYLTHTRGGRIREFNTFSRSIIPKGNVMSLVEFELAYLEAAVQQFSHCAI